MSFTPLLAIFWQMVGQQALHCFFLAHSPQSCTHPAHNITVDQEQCTDCTKVNCTSFPWCYQEKAALTWSAFPLCLEHAGLTESLWHVRARSYFPSFKYICKTDENLWRTKGQKDSIIIRLLNLNNSSGAIKLPKYSVPEHLKKRAGRNLNQSAEEHVVLLCFIPERKRSTTTWGDQLDVRTSITKSNKHCTYRISSEVMTDNHSLCQHCSSSMSPVTYIPDEHCHVL